MRRCVSLSIRGRSLSNLENTGAVVAERSTERGLRRPACFLAGTRASFEPSSYKAGRLRQVDKVSLPWKFVTLKHGLKATPTFLSGIHAAGGLAIADVIHQACVDIDKVGTEVAAATAVTIGTTAMPAGQQVSLWESRGCPSPAGPRC
jgi:hypothetical protein